MYQSEHCLDLEHDQQIAHELQRIFYAEVSTPEEENSSVTDSCSGVASLGKQGDHSSQLFIVIRRGAL